MKFNGLFITDLKKSARKHNFVTKSTDKIKTSKSIEEIQLKSAFMSRNDKHFNETKYTMVEYIINEETQFVDLIKCHDYYEEVSNKYHKNYNINQNDLIKKKKRLKELEDLVETVNTIYIIEEIISNVYVQKTEIDSFYKNLMFKLEKKLEQQKHDFDNFYNVQNKLIESSISLNEQIYNFIELEDKSSALSKKYKLMKEHAQVAYKRQKYLHNDLVDYDKKFSEMYDEEIKNKKAKFKELEYQVFKIKDSTVTIQNKIEELKIKIIRTKELISSTKSKNFKINEDKRNIRKDYLLTRIQLLKIFKKLKYKTLDDIIILYNTETKSFHNQYSTFLKINKDIQEMNNIYTELNSKYLGLRQEIKQIIKSNKKEINKKYDDPENISHISTINELCENNINLNFEMNEKFNILYNFLSNLKRYSLKICKFFQRFKEQHNHSYDETIKESNRLNFQHITEDDIQNIGNLMNWDFKDTVKILNFLNKFQLNINYIFYLTNSNIANNIDLVVPLDKNNPIVIDFNSSEVTSKIEENISKAMYNLENKYKILHRSDRELFMECKPMVVEKKKDPTNKQTNLKNIFSTFEKSKYLVGPTSLTNSIKPKLLKHLSKFTNYLVIENNPPTVEHTKEAKRKEKQDLINQKKIEEKKIEEKINTEKNDSYREEDRLIEPIIKPIHINLASKELFKSELNKIYKKVGEVNKLHTKYVSEKDNMINNNDFNQIYYKLKKKNDQNTNSSQRKLRINSPKVRENKQSSLPPNIKLFGLDENKHISRNNKSSTITPSITSKKNYTSTVLQPIIENKSSLNLKLINIKRNQYRHSFLDDLFSNDYLKENEEEINKYLKKS